MRYMIRVFIGALLLAVMTPAHAVPVTLELESGPTIRGELVFRDDDILIVTDLRGTVYGFTYAEVKSMQAREAPAPAEEAPAPDENRVRSLAALNAEQAQARAYERALEHAQTSARTRDAAQKREGREQPREMDRMHTLPQETENLPGQWVFLAPKNSPTIRIIGVVSSPDGASLMVGRECNTDKEHLLIAWPDSLGAIVTLSAAYSTGPQRSVPTETLETGLARVSGAARVIATLKGVSEYHVIVTNRFTSRRYAFDVKGITGSLEILRRHCSNR